MPPENKTVINPSEFGKLLGLKRPTIVTPKIIEEDKEVVRPDVLQAVVQLAQLGQLVKIRKSLEKTGESLEKQEFEGVLVPKTLSATDKVRQMAPVRTWPYVPWISAFFVNDGPNAARLAINEPSERFELGAHETRTISRAHAEERIHAIYYVCEKGKTASIRVEGEY